MLTRRKTKPYTPGLQLPLIRPARVVAGVEPDAEGLPRHDVEVPGNTGLCKKLITNDHYSLMITHDHSSLMITNRG